MAELLKIDIDSPQNIAYNFHRTTAAVAIEASSKSEAKEDEKQAVMLDFAKILCGVKLLTTSNECKKPSGGQQKEIPDFELQDCQAMMMTCTKSRFEEVDGKLVAEHNSIPTSRSNRVKQSHCELRNGHETSQTQEEEVEEVTVEFSYLSDTDDLAVEDLISQTKGLYVLEQIAAINGSPFTVDGSLSPSHLESRFRKLKSFHLPKPQTMLLNFEQSQSGVDARIRPQRTAISLPSKKRNPDEKPRRKSTTEYDPVYSPMDYPDSWRKSKSKSP